MRRFTTLVVLLLVAAVGGVPLADAGPPAPVTLCHAPGTPAEKTLTLPAPAAEAHVKHGDRLGSCEDGVPCAAPPPIQEVPAGTEPVEEPEYVSEAVAVLEGASEKGFTAVGAPVTFRLSCPTLDRTADSVVVYDNGLPLPSTALTTTENSVTVAGGLAAGRHEVALSARDVHGYAIDARFVLWVGPHTIPVVVLDEAGAPVAGASVVAKLSDDPTVTTSLVTDAAGAGSFTNLPNRSYNVIAQASGNRFATRPSSVFDGTVVLRLLGTGTPSAVDNNDFAHGTDGWDVGSAPVSVIPHVDDSPSVLAATSGRAERTPEGSAQAAAALAPADVTAEAADFDLALDTAGEGQQSISRTFAVEAGVKSVTVRYRFITSEVPGGWFGSEFNDFYNVALRTTQAGGVVSDGNSMNGLGLAAFDAGGATGWRESELAVNPQGDTVRVDLAVANVADGLFDSRVVVDVVKKKKLTVSQVQLRDIDNQPLNYLSASGHTYFGGQTRVHGTITVQGPKEDSLTELALEVVEGGTTVRGTLAAAVRPTMITAFGDDEQNQVTANQLLFEVPAAQLAGINQTANGQLTLRVRARSSSGETAERTVGAVTKLVRFDGGNRYGGRDTAVGGDDWARPTVKSFIDGAGQTWGDFSNMNGGPFAPHSSHQSGTSADGWFAGYNNRDAATAATIIGHLNTHGTRIRTVYVTYAAGGTFAQAIAGVTLNDGRAATAVIRPYGGHTTHFHWEVNP
ncbi:MAG: carboxypeptidase regulatory-like domain-containing protein [Saccharothrix sp.]|nr:carboxypeptidase regulatory-like domain-containing protein [Saccharothrix sp.]